MNNEIEKNKKDIDKFINNLKLEKNFYPFKKNKLHEAFLNIIYWALCLIRDEQLLQMYILPTDTLKNITRRYLDTDRNVVGGDLKQSKGVIVPIDDIAHGYKF